ncbi:MAG: PmoA family protein [Planctomycetota bacterium]|nr:PmoA family protein [Planctomycetota bacterium]
MKTESPVLLLTILLMLLWPGTNAESVTVRVSAGKYDRADVPVSMPLPDSLKNYGHFMGERLDDGSAVNVQLATTPNPHLVWMIGQTLKAGQSRQYRLSGVTDVKDEAPELLMLNTDGNLQAQIHGKTVFRYNHKTVPSPFPQEPFYARSGQIHPVFTPSGKLVTDDFAPDHKHQHGIMFAWTDTTFEGNKFDFWNQKKKQGTVAHASIEGQGNGNVFCWFKTKLAHLDIRDPEKPNAILNETWTVRVYNSKSPYLFEIESRQTCATNAPLQINKYHYGGMAFRGSRSWTGGGSYDYLTSEGKNREDGNHSRPNWSAIFGQTEGQWCGATILGHPENFRFPQPVRLHPQMPYFVFAPLVLGPFKIEPRKEYVSRYRYLIHDGKPDAAVADACWNDYASPAKVEVTK